MTASPSKQHSDMAAEEELDQETLGKEISKKKCGQQAFSWKKMEEVAQDEARWIQVVCEKKVKYHKSV